jgi:hypothetical protein
MCLDRSKEKAVRKTICKPQSHERGLMNRAGKPLQRKGERNVFCPLYKGCLDRAVKESWPHWDCGDCQHKRNEGGRPEMRLMAADSIEYHDLRLRF